jgi:hypothetical protein
MASSADDAGAGAGASSAPCAEENADDHYYGEGMVPLEDLPKFLKKAEQDRIKDHVAWLKLLEEVSRSLSFLLAAAMPKEEAGLSNCPDFHTSHFLPTPTHPRVSGKHSICVPD